MTTDAKCRRTAEVLVPVGGGDSVGADALLIASLPPETQDQLLRIGVIPAAYGPGDAANRQLARQRADELERRWTAARGGGRPPCEAVLIEIFSRSDADHADIGVRELATGALDAIYFLGGDQTDLMRALAGSRLERSIAEAAASGLVIGGSSAGAAVQSRTMLAAMTDGAVADDCFQEGAIALWRGDRDRGLDCGSRRVLIDQHFHQRGRWGRLLNALAQCRALTGTAGPVGVGVDYGTAVRIVADTRLEAVAGPSSIAILDIGRVSAGPARWGDHRTLSMSGVLAHLIAPGDWSYDLVARRPLVGGTSVPPPAVVATSDHRGSAPAGTLMLAADGSEAHAQEAFRDFAQAAEKRASRIVLVDVNKGRSTDGTALRAAGWEGTVLSRSQDDLDATAVEPTDAVLVLGDRSAALDSPGLGRWLRRSLAHASAVMIAGSLVAAAGDWFVADGELTDEEDLENRAIREFQVDGLGISEGLGVLSGFGVETRLLSQYRWGRLFGLAYHGPSPGVLGLADGAVVSVEAGKVRVGGRAPVVKLDTSGSIFAAGTNGALGCLNAVVDVLAPGMTAGTISVPTQTER